MHNLFLDLIIFIYRDIIKQIGIWSRGKRGAFWTSYSAELKIELAYPADMTYYIIIS